MKIKTQILSRNTYLIIFLCILAASFILLNIGISLWAGDYRLDTTINHKYTLTDTTRHWLQQNRQNLYAKVYISENLAKEYPSLGQYAQQVLRLLARYKQSANGLLQIEIINVVPFSASEAEAKLQGIRGFPDTDGNSELYFGMVLGNNHGQSYVIPYLEPQRQSYLEHDISRIFSKLGEYKAPRIAVISPDLPIINHGQSFKNHHDWAFIRHLRSDYSIDTLDAGIAAIPSQYDVVLLFRPQKISLMAKYALDQYLLKGGNLIIVLDPFAESALNIRQVPDFENSQMTDFLASKHVAYSPDTIVGDTVLGRKAAVSNGKGLQLQSYPPDMQIKAPFINPDNYMTKDLQLLEVKSAGAFEFEGLENIRATTLYTTTETGGSINSQFMLSDTPQEIIQAFKHDNYRYKLGLLLEGQFDSMFDEHPLSGTPLVGKMPPFVSMSLQSGKLMLLGDSDMFADYNWNKAAADAESIYDFVPVNNNLDFIERAFDYMSGNKNILSVAPKDNIIKSSVSSTLKDYFRQAYQAEMSEHSQILQDLQSKMQNLNTALVNEKFYPSIEVTRQMNELQQQTAAEQNKLNELNYKTEAAAAQARQTIVALNVVFFPLFMLFIVWLSAKIFRRRNCQQAKEYTDE